APRPRKAPERRSKPKSGPERVHTFNRLPPPLQLQSITVPRLSQPPLLLQRDHFSSWLTPLLAPAIHMLFRPEEKDRFSSKDNIFPPVLRRNAEVNRPHRIYERPVLDRHSHCLVTTSTSRDNTSVLLQHSRNSQSIPDAISPPCVSANLDRKSGWNRRKRLGHQ